MRNLYQEQLQNLNRELIQMGAACEEIIDLAARSLTDYNRELEEKTAQVGATIDESERTIETICLKLLLRQQPVARDLRQISAAMKMITDMERIGDQAEDIVDLVPKMKQGAGENYSQIRQMAKAAQYMVTEAVNAYVKQDLERAKAVMDYDDVVDNYFNQIKNDILGFIAANPGEGEYALDLLMIDKYFERIGDHCTNIAEWVEFSVTGVHKDCQ
ncbi:MAG: phosphate signaling complex protein PhoU [Faecousia sp.]